jgi:hypothetical protein
MALTRFLLHAVPLLVLILALFGFAVEILDFEPQSGSVIRLALLEQPRVPAAVVIGSWLVEASGLVALFLLAQGRCGAWWLDGLVAGWIGWIFRGPLLVVTIVVAARQPQQPWWSLAFGWWVLYSVCGLSLAVLARRQERAEAAAAAPKEAEGPAPELPGTVEPPEVEEGSPAEIEAEEDRLYAEAAAGAGDRSPSEARAAGGEAAEPSADGRAGER